jgi:hypothetical protein
MRGYVSKRGQDGTAEVIVRETDGIGKGIERPLDPRLDLVNHSPDGFEWGYGGSGPAQLSLAIVADATGDDELALKIYQRMKVEVFGRLPQDRTWAFTREEIVVFAIAIEEAMKQGLPYGLDLLSDRP